MTTKELAAYLDVEPQTLRQSLSDYGCYYGVVPKRDSSFHWDWGFDAPEKILNNKLKGMKKDGTLRNK